MNSILTRDLLMNMLLGLTALVIVIVSVVNPPSSSATNAVSLPGSIAVAIAWPQGASDVDLWVTGPGQTIATGYSNRSGKLFSLLRDDLGVDGDVSPLNMENAFARATPPGEYIINVHGYSLPLGPQKVFVEVSLGQSADTMRLLVRQEILIRNGQERTVVRFTLDAKGDIVPGSVNEVYKPLRSVKK